MDGPGLRDDLARGSLLIEARVLHGWHLQGLSRPRLCRYLQQRGRVMILEVASLDVIAGQEREFEAAFGEAQAIISSMPGYISHQLQHCLENKSRYLLLVNWQTLEDHIVGFRQSEQYQQWRDLLHQFYDPFPTVEHYTTVYRRGE